MRHRYAVGDDTWGSTTGKSSSKGAQATSRRAVGIVLSVLAVLFLLKIIASSILNPLRSFLETVEIRADSPKHMLYFYLASQLMFIPTPLPFIITFYVLAAGYFFKARGFLLLFLSFITGIPLSFKAGRVLKHLGFNVRRHFKSRGLRGGLEYFDSLRNVLAEKPIRMCFMLMWAPLPTQLLPFLVGFLTDIGTKEFILGAVPSKLIHFSCPLIIGLEASSLSSALAGESTSWLSLIVVILPVALSIILLAAMAYYVKGALVKMKNGVTVMLYEDIL